MSGARVAGRVFIGLSLLATWGTLSSVVRTVGLPHARGLSALVPLGSVTTTPAAIAFTAVFLLAVAAFVARLRPLAATLVIVGLLALGGHVQSAQWAPQADFAHRALVLPGAGLTAWLLAAAIARRRGAAPEAADQVGIEAACGVAAACYTIAGMNKLLGSGLGWASGENLSMHMMVHSFGSLPALLDLRTAVATEPVLASIAGTGTLLIEGTFFLFVFPRLRVPYALAAAGLHMGIAVGMGLHHYDWMFMVLGLGLLGSPALRTRATRE